MDALACNREDEGDGGDVHSRVLSTLLNEMDGVSSNRGRGVLVVAATNRMHTIDAALLRPGRLEEHILLDMPGIADIEDIMRMHTAKMPLGKDVDLTDLAEVLFELEANGAIVEGICREACLLTIRNIVKPFDINDLVVPKSSFEEAICRWKR
uniref:ATPase AAA-type core domain-containing protein n=2 Tax=Ditylum brightwellii TaxID=49249 RepID=A0A7S4VVW8_9STRA